MCILMDLISIVRQSTRENRMKWTTLSSAIETNFVMNCFTCVKKRGRGWDTNIMAYGDGYPS